jgi:pimeloyl-ACP methyl ester carboxylesterase
MQVTRIQVVVDGVSISVKRMGQGMPIACLSATGHDAGDFEPLAQRLGDRFEFVCIEWPSHGESGADSVPASAARYAELLQDVLWQLGIRTPIVIGNSIGGAAAILHAARHPVRALVLCDSGGLVEVDNTVKKLCQLFERFFAAGERGAWWFQPLFALYYRIVLPSAAAATQRQRITANARMRAPALRQAWASFGKPEADVRAIAASLEIPIWVAWTKHDRVIPLSRCLPAIKLLQHATLDTFAGGHTAFLEQPDQFAEKFVQFLVTLDTSSNHCMAVAAA